MNECLCCKAWEITVTLLPINCGMETRLCGSQVKTMSRRETSEEKHNSSNLNEAWEKIVFFRLQKYRYV